MTSLAFVYLPTYRNWPAFGKKCISWHVSGCSIGLVTKTLKNIMWIQYSSDVPASFGSGDRSGSWPMPPFCSFCMAKTRPDPTRWHIVGWSCSVKGNNPPSPFFENIINNFHNACFYLVYASPRLEVIYLSNLSWHGISNCTQYVIGNCKV